VRPSGQCSHLHVAACGFSPGKQVKKAGVDNIGSHGRMTFGGEYLLLLTASYQNAAAWGGFRGLGVSSGIIPIASQCSWTVASSRLKHQGILYLRLTFRNGSGQGPSLQPGLARTRKPSVECPRQVTFATLKTAVGSFPSIFCYQVRGRPSIHNTRVLKTNYIDF